MEMGGKKEMEICSACRRSHSLHMCSLHCSILNWHWNLCAFPKTLQIVAVIALMFAFSRVNELGHYKCHGNCLWWIWQLWLLCLLTTSRTVTIGYHGYYRLWWIFVYVIAYLSLPPQKFALILLFYYWLYENQQFRQDTSAITQASEQPRHTSSVLAS